MNSNNDISTPADFKDNNHIHKSASTISNQYSPRKHTSNNTDDTLESEKLNVYYFIVDICKELFESVFSVFRFKSNCNVHIPANSEVVVPIEFLPQLAQYSGAVCITYAATFEADCVLNASQVNKT